MNRFIHIAFFLLLLNLVCHSVWGQQGSLASIHENLERLRAKPYHQKDTAYLSMLNQLAYVLADRDPDSALIILETLPRLCREVQFNRGETEAIKYLGNTYLTKGNNDKALQSYGEALALAEKYELPSEVASILNNIGTVRLMQGNYSEALNQYYQAITAAEQSREDFIKEAALNNIAIVYFYQGNLSDAEKAYKETLKYASSIGDTINIIRSYNNLAETNLEQKKPLDAYRNLVAALNLIPVADDPYLLALVNNTMGFTYLELDSAENAKSKLERSLLTARVNDYRVLICKSLLGLAKVELKNKNYDESLHFATESMQVAEQMGHTQLKRDASEILANIYEAKGDGLKALTYYRNFKVYADSLTTIASQRSAANYKTEYEFSRRELEFKQKASQQKWITFTALAALVTLGIILWIINRNKKRLDLAYLTLQQTNKQIEAEKQNAEDALGKLRSAQAQLIQSEKMASLGELTAGIAHEIQNPLNFVNNFSEVNMELSDEMEALLNSGKVAEAQNLATDIRNNHEKIREHGMRADSIVKSMLQHSRSSSGQKEPTDLNALADEYLRLSYHGMRAKDKLFNAFFELRAYPNLPKIAVSPQDIGRVMLNLFNNAFYAVNEKRKMAPEGFEAKVRVSTHLTSSGVEIRIEDNGTGISDTASEKIFQPFFTTKPTGQGTGLGLSLSYDIVKAHGGHLFVESVENQYTRFIISLPLSK